ncbi:MAG: hypothetical protein R2762_21135 [Bryobacteraceae bacterium]
MSLSVSDSIGDTRFVLFLLALFGAVSVLLAALGIHGTLTYLTARRTREFGIRLALGSSGRAIVAILPPSRAPFANCSTGCGRSMD